MPQVSKTTPCLKSEIAFPMWIELREKWDWTFLSSLRCRCFEEVHTRDEGRKSVQQLLLPSCLLQEQRRDGLPGPCPGSFYDYSFISVHNYCAIPTHWCLRIIWSICRHLQSCPLVGFYLFIYLFFFFYYFFRYVSYSSQILATTHFIWILNWEMTVIELQISSSSRISWKCLLLPGLSHVAVSLAGLCPTMSLRSFPLPVL